MRFLLALLVPPSLVACGGPPDAPAELDNLCAYLYAHHPDEDVEAMEVASDNLLAWMDTHWEATEGGYEIGPLDQATMDALDDQERGDEELAGIAVVTTSAHSVDEVAYAMVMVDQNVVYPDQFVEYVREYDGDPACFMDHECERVASQEWMDSQFVTALLTVTSTSHSINQYLWTDGETSASTMVHRNWLTEPPTVDPDWLGVTEQYFLQVFVPRPDGHYRLQAMWVTYASDVVPKETGLGISANSFESNSETLEAWMDANPMP